MNLIELISFFRNEGSFKELCNNFKLDESSEGIEIYYQKKLSLYSNLFFFEIEKTKGNIKYIHQNTLYYNLIDFYFLLNFIKEVENSEMSDKELAMNLIKYLKNDG